RMLSDAVVPLGIGCVSAGFRRHGNSLDCLRRAGFGVLAHALLRPPVMPRTGRRDALKRLTAVAFGVALPACQKEQEQQKPTLEAAAVDEDKLAALTKSAELEKTDLKLGFIKLTDCAPLVIAKEKGFFEAEGLNVNLEAQANWKV